MEVLPPSSSRCPERALAIRPAGADACVVYRGGSYGRVLDQIRGAVSRREGLVLVIGDAGAGKTTLCRTLAADLHSSAFVSVVLDPSVGPDELLLRLLSDFGIDPPAGAGRRALTITLHRFLASLVAINAHAVVIFDEAHHLDPRVLEQVRVWSNFEAEGARLLQIVLVGPPDLDRLLRRPYMRPLYQRIARQCELQPFADRDVRAYAARRLEIAGRGAVVRTVRSGAVLDIGRGGAALPRRFTGPALSAIANVSRGAPHAVSGLCATALDIAQARGSRTVDRSIVRAAARRVGLYTGASRKRTKMRVAAAITFLLLIAAPIAARLSRSADPGDGAARPEVEATAELREPRPGRPPVAAFGAGGIAAVGTLGTADGLTVAVATHADGARAGRLAEAIQNSGLPAFRRPPGSGETYGVLVGPYVSLDEAQSAQRRLADQGLFDTEILPREPRYAVADGMGAAVSPVDNRHARVVLVSSPGRYSLLLDLPSEPRQVHSRHVGATTVEVESGPLTADIAGQELNVAAGQPLAHVSIGSYRHDSGDLFLRARISLRAPSRSDIRVEGRRVYVDFSSRPAVDRAMTRQTADARHAAVGSYRLAAGTAVQQFEQAAPFLLSVAASPTEDSLAAVARTFAAIDASLRTVAVPADSAGRHQLLTTAVATASRAMETTFAGDRVAEARRALSALELAQKDIEGPTP